MELDKSDDVRRRRPKGHDIEYQPLSDDDWWEKAKKKPGNESLEPRRILFHYLEVKLRLWHLQTVRWTRGRMTRWNCTSYMSNIITRHQLNFDVAHLCWIFLIEKYEEVYNKRRICSMSVAPPPRTKISGIRASVFGMLFLLIILKSSWKRRSM